MYYVYILTNKPNGVLYIGITNDLVKRVYQHKQNLVEGFTKKYHVHMLVYFEQFQQVKDAILREKQMKKWNRQWKINKIIALNPQWKDLYTDLL